LKRLLEFNFPVKELRLSSIERIDNRIIVTGELYDFHRFLSILHTIVQKLKYQDVILDFESCTSAYQNSMLSVCAQVMACRSNGISFSVLPPAERQFDNLFKNSNWGFFLDPDRYEPSNFRGYTRIPATQYRTPSEQQAAVNRIVNVMLGAIPELERSDLAAFEWAVNELTDNVLVHSESPIGGLVQVSTFAKFRKRIQFVVADAGIGVPTSLRSGHAEITSDAEALDWAIREGVTRDVTVGQGNGMFGSFQICSMSGGEFIVDSGYALLKYHARDGLSIKSQNIPYVGTLVVATIDFSDSKLLEEALSFGGSKHKPVDFVETKYEINSIGDIKFNLIEECQSFGSRVSGKPVQVKLINLLKMNADGVVVIDFSGVPLLSSSFADEAFGKLFLLIGPVKFMQRIKLVNMMGTVERLINKAIAQRMQVGVSDIE